MWDGRKILSANLKIEKALIIHNYGTKGRLSSLKVSDSETEIITM